MSTTHINYYGRTGMTYGATKITFINHNPDYCRIYSIDTDGTENYQGTVAANNVKTYDTTGNYLWVIKRRDYVPIRVCKAQIPPAKNDPGTVCIASNQRLPAWPNANFTFDIVGKTLTQPAVELRVPVKVLITSCTRSNTISVSG